MLYHTPGIQENILAVITTYPAFSRDNLYLIQTHCTAIELLQSGKKLGMVSTWGWPHTLNWKSTTFTNFNSIEFEKNCPSPPSRCKEVYFLAFCNGVSPYLCQVCTSNSSNPNLNWHYPTKTKYFLIRNSLTSKLVLESCNKSKAASSFPLIPA